MFSFRSTSPTNSDKNTPSKATTTANEQALLSTIETLQLLVDKERTTARISGNRLRRAQNKLAKAEEEITGLKNSVNDVKVGNVDGDGGKDEEARREVEVLKGMLAKEREGRDREMERASALEGIVREKEDELDKMRGDLVLVGREVGNGSNGNGNGNGGDRLDEGLVVRKVKERMEELEDRLKVLVGENGEKEGKLKLVMGSLEGKEREVNGLKENLRRFEEDLEHQEQVVAEKEQTLESVLAEREMFENKASVLEKEVEGKRRIIESDIGPQLERAKARNRNLSEQVVELKNQVENVRGQLDEKTRDFEEERGTLSKRIVNAMEVLEGTQRRLASVEKDCAEQEELIVQLRSNKGENEERISSLDEELNHKNSSLRTLNGHLLEIERSASLNEATLEKLKAESEMLKRDLFLSSDRAEAAEARASRKDTLVVDLEGIVRTKRIEMKEMEEQSVMASESVAKVTEGSKEMQRALEMHEEASKKHAEVAASREEDACVAMKSLKETLTEKQSIIQGLTDDLKSAEGRIDDLIDKLQGSRNDYSNKVAELATRTAQYDEQGKSLGECRQTLLQRDAELETLISELEDTRNKLTASEKSVATQNRLIVDRDADIARLHLEIASRDRDIERLHGDMAGVETESELRHAKVNRLLSEKASMQKDIELRENEKVELMSQILELKESLAIAQNEVADRERDIEGREEDIQELRSKMDSLEVSIKSKKRQVAVLESHLEGTSSVLDQYTENEELLASCRAQLRQEEAKVLTLTDQLEQFDEDGQVAKEVGTEDLRNGDHEREELIEMRDDEKRTRVAVEKELQETSDKLAALEQRYESELEAQVLKATSLEKKLSEKDSSEKSLTTSMTRKLAEIVRLKAEVAAYSSRGSKILEEVSELRAKVEASQKAILERDTKLKRKDEQLREVSGSCEKATNEAEKYRQEVAQLQSERNNPMMLANSHKPDSTTDVDLLTLKSKLEAKEKAIRNLHNWCRFINEKLHTAEQLLSDREEILDLNKKAILKLEDKTRQLTKIVASREADLKDANAKYITETSSLRKRIQVLNTGK